MNIDRVEYQSGGSKRSMSVPEFLLLPLFDRVQAVMEGRVEFFSAGAAVPADVALFALRAVSADTAHQGRPVLARVQSCGLDHALGLSAGVVVGIWRQQLGAQLAKRLAELCAEAATNGGGAVLHVCEATFEPLADGTASQLAAALDRLCVQRLPTAVVLVTTRTGLPPHALAWSTARSAPHAMLHLRVNDAVQWLSYQLGDQASSVRGLGAAAAELRRMGLSGTNYVAA